MFFPNSLILSLLVQCLSAGAPEMRISVQAVERWSQETLEEESACERGRGGIPKKGTFPLQVTTVGDWSLQGGLDGFHIIPPKQEVRKPGRTPPSPHLLDEGCFQGIRVPPTQ